jgi:hypothetical protein
MASGDGVVMQTIGAVVPQVLLDSRLNGSAKVRLFVVVLVTELRRPAMLRATSKNAFPMSCT